MFTKWLVLLQNFMPQHKSHVNVALEALIILTFLTVYIICAPFHVVEIIDDVDDMAWYRSTLIIDVIDFHADEIKAYKA